MAGKTYRCPVDDVIFDSSSSDKQPHHSDGHVDCPGPKCREKYGKGEQHASLDS